MVRLKACASPVLRRASLFQFHMVRLKEPARGQDDRADTPFQFHMVRLKGLKGLIMSLSLMYFNSIWCD